MHCLRRKYIMFLHMISQRFIRKTCIAADLCKSASFHCYASTNIFSNKNSHDLFTFWRTKTCKDCRWHIFTKTFRSTLMKSSAILRWKKGDCSYTDWWLKFAEHKWTASLQFTNASLCVTISDFNSELSLLLLLFSNHNVFGRSQLL